MVKKYFNLDELGTNVRQEMIAGATTFVTMAYIIIVNPKNKITPGLWVLSVLSVLFFIFLFILKIFG